MIGELFTILAVPVKEPEPEVPDEANMTSPTMEERHNLSAESLPGKSFMSGSTDHGTGATQVNGSGTMTLRVMIRLGRNKKVRLWRLDLELWPLKFLWRRTLPLSGLQPGMDEVV